VKGGNEEEGKRLAGGKVKKGRGKRRDGV